MKNAQQTNPWLVASLQDVQPGAATTNGGDRMYMVKNSTDVAWLRRVMAWEDTQLTVRKAAEARLRKLSRERQVVA